MLRKNIVLCGFSGSGKTTVGRMLARKMGRFFVDTDQMIEDKTSMTIAKIFEVYGEEGFRRIESDVIKSVSKLHDVVLAVGGGAVMKQENVELLKKNGLIIFLNVPVEVLLLRLGNDSSRPLLAAKDLHGKRERVEKLHNERYAIYRQIADIELDASESPCEVTQKIFERVNQFGLTEENSDFVEEVVPIRTESKKYHVKVGYGIVDRSLVEFLKTRLPAKIALVTNVLLNQLAGKAIVEKLKSEGFDAGTVLIEDSEARKSPETLFKIIDGFVNLNLDRDSVVVALGGGVIGDVTGFAASIYMRGVEWVYIPTTLLAQVDSSVGGKVAVNYGEKKNFLGVFHQPSLVVTDIGFLKVLPDEIFTEGLAEVVKSAVIEKAGLFDFLEKNISKVIERDASTLLKIVTSCVRLKGHIVEQDERDQGLRMLLNLGHTFGHAIEASLKYQISHAKAVSVGLALEVDLANKAGYTGVRTKDRVTNMLRVLGLPTDLREVGLNHPADLLEYLKFDKKAVHGKIRFALPFGIGDVRIVEYNPNEVRNLVGLMKEVRT